MKYLSGIVMFSFSFFLLLFVLAPERVEPGGAEEEPGGGKEAAITGEIPIMAIKLNIPRDTGCFFSLGLPLKVRSTVKLI